MKHTRTEELADRMAVYFVNLPMPEMCAAAKRDFLAALLTYGQEVRKRDVEICVSGMHDDAGNAHNFACHDCAAAIEREPLP